MKVQSGRDTAAISDADLQAIVKDAVLKATGREVDGDVYYEMRPGSLTLPTAYCHLKPAPAAA